MPNDPDEFRRRSREHCGRTMIDYANKIAALMCELQADGTTNTIEGDAEVFEASEGFDAANVVEHLRDAAGTAYLLAHELAGVNVSAQILSLMAPPDGGRDDGPTRRPWR